MPSIFSRIVNGEIPCHKVAENESCLAFLDINPLKKGHTLIIPKIEVDYIFDLDDSTFSELHLFSKKVSIAIQKTIPCLRIGVSVIGLEVPHAHIHLIPLSTMHDINFANPKLKLGSDEMKEIAASIAQNYEA